MKKANEKHGSFLGRHPGLAEEFNKCVDESMSVEEFEASWAKLGSEVGTMGEQKLCLVEEVCPHMGAMLFHNTLLSLLAIHTKV
jgi:hypothetical protein